MLGQTAQITRTVIFSICLILGICRTDLQTSKPLNMMMISTNSKPDNWEDEILASIQGEVSGLCAVAWQVKLMLQTTPAAIVAKVIVKTKTIYELFEPYCSTVVTFSDYQYAFSTRQYAFNTLSSLLNCLCTRIAPSCRCQMCT